MFKKNKEVMNWTSEATAHKYGHSWSLAMGATQLAHESVTALVLCTAISSMEVQHPHWSMIAGLAGAITILSLPTQ